MAPKPIWIVGIDEVGRGPLAGPVSVAAVAMTLQAYKKMRWKGLRDSKQMSSRARRSWHLEAQRLHNEGKLKIATSSRSAEAIDTRGIAACIASCIASALLRLNLKPSECLVLLDGGLRAPKEYVYQQTIVRGDDSQKIISLASVVAKVSRDRYMARLHKKHPSYAWFDNKGYGTRAHIEAILSTGITPLHRKSFLSKVLDK